MKRFWIVLFGMGLVQAAFAATLPWDPTPSPAAAAARARAIADLGRQLFFDPSLSASGKMACATCHDPAHAFSAPNTLSVQLGGADMKHAGIRAVPSLMYAQETPPFIQHFHESDDEGDESVDQGPTGGRTWDGRVDRVRDQAAIPLLDINEMANPDRKSVVGKVARAPYAVEIRRLYGQTVFADPARAFAAITEALEYFQQTPGIFSPFSSKYDAYLRGEATLTAQEARGLDIFNDPDRGNCIDCHKSGVAPDGHPPMFTDFGYVALAVPRNMAIPANLDPNWFDLGLCGPERHDLAHETDECGMFKAPTLRNVALRRSFYHNGLYHTLRQAVEFYALRDTQPEKWYPTGPDGKVQMYNDIPARYRDNISMEMPFGPKRVLSDQDVDDLVAFLETLTDGYKPPP